MHWLAVASREHVKRGIAGGFAQVCHGKPGPLKQMSQAIGLFTILQLNFLVKKYLVASLLQSVLLSQENRINFK